MNTPSKSSGYMLLFRGMDWHLGLSPEEMQKVANQWMAWFEGLKQQGKVVTGSPLEFEGKTVSGPNGRVVSDRPFAEAKEAIGGYFLLKVEDLDEAVAVAKGCPGLPFGLKVEVRAVAAECPLLAEARSEEQLAGASA